MNKLIAVALGMFLFGANAYVWAEDAPVSYGNDSGTNALRVDDSEVKTDFGQDKPAEKPVNKSKLKKPRVGFKTTVKPEEMKSYHRSESGDVSAQ